MVDLTKIKQVRVIDANGSDGYFDWDDTAALSIPKGSRAGTAEHAGKTYPLGRSAPAPAPVPIPTPVPVPGPNSGLVLNISEDAYQGDAQYTIAVDGTQIGGVRTATASHSAGKSEQVALGPLSLGQRQVSVTFLNDSYGGTAQTDRNLYVNSATYNGQIVPGSSLAFMSAGSRSFTVTGDAQPAPTPIPVPVPTPVPTPAPTPLPAPIPVPAQALNAWAYHVKPGAISCKPGETIMLEIAGLGGPFPKTGTFSFVATLASTGKPNGTFGAFVVPYGTSNTFQVPFTPAVEGMTLITATNTLGLVDYGEVPVSVFAPSTGSAGTVTQDANQVFSLKNFQTNQCKPWRGAVNGGWDAKLVDGWALFKLAITLPNPTNALFARLYLGDTPGADVAVIGSGTLAHDKVQVAGNLPAGAQNIWVNVPSFGLTYLMLELSTDGVSWYRLPRQFGVGDVGFTDGRSYDSGTWWWWAQEYGAETPDFLALADGFRFLSTFIAPPINDNNFGQADWIRNDGSRPGGVPGGGTSPGGMKLAAMIARRTKRPMGWVGGALQGGSIHDHYDAHGVPNDKSITNAARSANNGITYARFSTWANRDGGYSAADYKHMFAMTADWLRALAKSPILVSFDVGNGYRNGQNMSQPGGGYVAVQKVIDQLMDERRDVCGPVSFWGGYFSSHPDILSRPQRAVGNARALTDRMDPAFGGDPANPWGLPLGPRLAPGKGYRLPGEATLRCPILHRGGNALVAIRIEQKVDNSVSPAKASLSVTTPTAQEMHALGHVRLAGNVWGVGRAAVSKTIWWEPGHGVALQLDDANPFTIHNDVNELHIHPKTVQVAGVTSLIFKDGSTIPLDDTLAFDAGFGADYAINQIVPGQPSVWVPVDVNGISYGLTDNNMSDGWVHGRGLMREIGYTIASPTRVPAKVTLDPPAWTFSNGWLEIKGKGLGDKMGSVQFSLDGGAPASPVWSRIENGNDISAVIRAPATDGAHTLGVHPNGGEATDAKSFATGQVAQFLGGTDIGGLNLSPQAMAMYAESYSGNNAKIFTDTAGTKLAGTDFDVVQAWYGDGPNGAANRLGLQLGQFNTPMPLPMLHFDAQVNTTGNFTLDCTQPEAFTNHLGVLFEGGALGGKVPALVSKMTGDFTVVAAYRTEAGFTSFPIFSFYNADWRAMIHASSFYNTGYFSRGGQVWNDATAPVPDGGAHVFGMRYRAATAQFEVYLLTLGQAPIYATKTMAPEAAPAMAGMYLRPGWGPMPSIIFFGGALPDADFSNARNGLYNRWIA